MTRLATVIILAACGTHTSPTGPDRGRQVRADQTAACNALPVGARRIELHPFVVPPECVLEARAPIVDDASLHAALVVWRTRAPCTKPVAPVDFIHDRLDSFTIEANDAPQVTWVATRDHETLARVVMPTTCGGERPGEFQIWMVVPKDVPPLVLDLCTIGGCSGPPRP